MTIVRPKSVLTIVATTALILMVPLVAMQFTREVDWDVRDFSVIGTLLLSTGLLYELIANQLKKKEYQILVGLVLAVLLFLTWAELAVGIFGTPFAGS